MNLGFFWEATSNQLQYRCLLLYVYSNENNMTFTQPYSFYSFSGDNIWAHWKKIIVTAWKALHTALTGRKHPLYGIHVWTWIPLKKINNHLVTWLNQPLGKNIIFVKLGENLPQSFAVKINPSIWDTPPTVDHVWWIGKYYPHPWIGCVKAVTRFGAESSRWSLGGGGTIR